jgi:hypothetical protein
METALPRMDLRRLIDKRRIILWANSTLVLHLREKSGSTHPSQPVNLNSNSDQEHWCATRKENSGESAQENGCAFSPGGRALLAQPRHYSGVRSGNLVDVELHRCSRAPARSPMALDVVLLKPLCHSQRPPGGLLEPPRPTVMICDSVPRAGIGRLLCADVC